MSENKSTSRRVVIHSDALEAVETALQSLKEGYAMASDAFDCAYNEREGSVADSSTFHEGVAAGVSYAMTIVLQILQDQSLEVDEDEE